MRKLPIGPFLRSDTTGSDVHRIVYSHSVGRTHPAHDPDNFATQLGNRTRIVEANFCEGNRLAAPFVLHGYSESRRRKASGRKNEWI